MICFLWKADTSLFLKVHNCTVVKGRKVIEVPEFPLVSENQSRTIGSYVGELS